MKPKLPLFIISVIVVGSLILSSYGIGSPGGYSGSPANNSNNCTVCHGSMADPVDNWISTNIPYDGYLPGETYTITTTFTASGVNRAGFEISVQNTDNQHQGTLVITDEFSTKIKHYGKSVTHTGSGIQLTQGTRSWSFDWIAPDEIVDTITFYAAFYGGGHVYQTEYQTGLNTVGLSKISSDVAVFPNPTTGEIHIHVPRNVAAFLYDLRGSLILEKQIYEKDILNLEPLKTGSYILNIPELNIRKQIIRM
ncbi:MAG: T9SS type A sorting domain-containing protein [Bacteroidales bacterium]|nr:T9SS type A sorting domain-containing protein [Bacteroidales bacterium]